MSMEQNLVERVTVAYQTVRTDLLAQRNAAGHWTGELSTSSLSTATAVSALALVRKNLLAASELTKSETPLPSQELIAGGIRWLADHQNSDGGFGDTDRSYSNIATTMLVVAAIQASVAFLRYVCVSRAGDIP